MELMTVAQFAAELKMPAPALLEQLERAGVKKKAPADTVTEQDKSALLDFLRKSLLPTPRCRSSTRGCPSSG